MGRLIEGSTFYVEHLRFLARIGDALTISSWRQSPSIDKRSAGLIFYEIIGVESGIVEGIDYCLYSPIAGNYAPQQISRRHPHIRLHIQSKGSHEHVDVQFSALGRRGVAVRFYQDGRLSTKSCGISHFEQISQKRRVTSRSLYRYANNQKFGLFDTIERAFGSASKFNSEGCSAKTGTYLGQFEEIGIETE
jgi:hypothetical protein